MKTGVLIVGMRGATASTLVATALNPRAEDARFLLSEGETARKLPLPHLDELVFAGWDVRRETWTETFARHGVLHPSERSAAARRVSAAVTEWPAAVLAEDHAAAAGETEPSATSGEALLATLRGQIRAFRESSGVEHLVLVSLAAPARLPPRDEWPNTAPELMHALASGRLASAMPYYFAAAILEGAAVADYTASATLELPGLIALAESEGVPVAGRDGSTGQTLLKSVLAETFATRRLRIRGWYSTNILGNHDGLVLQDPRYADVKHHDKSALLDEILEAAGSDPVDSHLVDIRYYLPAGDEKEAWDAIDFETWSGGRGQLRINWRASDSLLATPPILDVVRFLALARSRGLAGVQAELGMFFKHPLGTNERRYLHLARALEGWLRAMSSDTRPDGAAAA